MTVIKATERQMGRSRPTELTSDVEAATVVDAQVRRRIAGCPYPFFLNQVTWHFNEGVLILEGRVATERLKCALNSLLSEIEHIEQVTNCVDVINASGVSSIRPS